MIIEKIKKLARITLRLSIVIIRARDISEIMRFELSSYAD